MGVHCRGGEKEGRKKKKREGRRREGKKGGRKRINKLEGCGQSFDHKELLLTFFKSDTHCCF